MRFVVRRAYKLPVIEEKLPQDFDRENDPRHPIIIFRGMSVGESLAMESLATETLTRVEIIKKELDLVKALMIEAKGDFSLFIEEKIDTKDKDAILLALPLEEYVSMSMFAIHGREVKASEQADFLGT